MPALVVLSVVAAVACLAVAGVVGLRLWRGVKDLRRAATSGAAKVTPLLGELTEEAAVAAEELEGIQRRAATLRRDPSASVRT